MTCEYCAQGISNKHIESFMGNRAWAKIRAYSARGSTSVMLIMSPELGGGVDMLIHYCPMCGRKLNE